MAMQRQKGIKTNEPFEPKNVEDNMKKGGKVKKMAAGGKTNDDLKSMGRNMAKLKNQFGK